MRASVAAVAAMAVTVIAAAACFHIISDHGDGSGYELEDVMGSVLEITCYRDGSKSTVGTGFVVDYDGHVLTNAHLVVTRTSGMYEPYDVIKARNANSAREYELSMIRYDSENDLALLKISAENNPRPLTINVGRPCYGERITVIGNALGYGLSVREGLVSIPEIDIVSEGTTLNCLMVSLSINHGDSGSPIINDRGEVIGMASFMLKTKDMKSNGISFGISSKSMRSFLEQSYASLFRSVPFSEKYIDLG